MACRRVPQELLGPRAEGLVASPVRLLIIQHSVQRLLVQDDLAWFKVSTCAAMPPLLAVNCNFIVWHRSDRQDAWTLQDRYTCTTSAFLHRQVSVLLQ